MDKCNKLSVPDFGEPILDSKIHSCVIDEDKLKVAEQIIKMYFICNIM